MQGVEQALFGEPELKFEPGPFRRALPDRGHPPYNKLVAPPGRVKGYRPLRKNFIAVLGPPGNIRNVVFKKRAGYPASLAKQGKINVAAGMFFKLGNLSPYNRGLKDGILQKKGRYPGR